MAGIWINEKARFSIDLKDHKYPRFTIKPDDDRYLPSNFELLFDGVENVIRLINELDAIVREVRGTKSGLTAKVVRDPEPKG